MNRALQWLASPVPVPRGIALAAAVVAVLTAINWVLVALLWILQHLH